MGLGIDVGGVGLTEQPFGVGMVEIVAVAAEHDVVGTGVFRLPSVDGFCQDREGEVDADDTQEALLAIGPGLVSVVKGFTI